MFLELDFSKNNLLWENSGILFSDKRWLNQISSSYLFIFILFICSLSTMEANSGATSGSKLKQ